MRHPAPDDADADVDDLDHDPRAAEDVDGGARPDGAGSRRRSGSPGWHRWGRSPWALPATVTVLLLVGGGAGLRQAHAAADAGLVREGQLSAVQLGAVTAAFEVSPSTGEPVGDPQRQRVQVAVLNSGGAPVSVSAVGVSLEEAALAPGGGGVSLLPGTGGVLDLALEVDCDALPFDPSATTPPAPTAEWLALAVDVGGDTTERRYLLPDTGWGGMAQQLAYSCHPNAWNGGVSAAPTLAGDGTLHVGLTNVQDDAVRVVLQAPASLGVTSDPPLPLDLPTGGTAEVRLALAPDCARLPEGIGDPYALPVELLAQTGGGGAGVLDPTTSAVWVARQVALACG